jgi:anti-sigma factor RsiW
MHCQRVREKFVDFLDGDARRTEYMIVQVHLAQCPACRRALQETKALIEQSRKALAHPEPRDRFPQLMERIATEEAQYGFHWPRVWRLVDHRRAVVAAAAGFAIVVAASAPLLAGLPGSDSGTGTAGDAAADRVPGVSIPFVERVNELDERLEEEGVTENDELEAIGSEAE